MDFAKIRGVAFWLLAAGIALASSGAHAQTSEHGPLMLRLQLEPGVMLARQNGPLILALNAAELGGSFTVAMNLFDSTALGVEAWFALAVAPSLDITPPDFDGAGETVSVDGPSMTALLVGPNITQVFDEEMFSVSATLGAAFGSFDYDSYPKDKLPYNFERTIDPITGETNKIETPIPLDKTGVGLGFGVALAKHFALADHLLFGVGVQFRYLSIPDDAVYFDYSSRGNLRFRADSWSITTFALNASVTYF